RLERRFAGEMTDDFEERARGQDARAFRERRLRRIGLRQDEGTTRLARAERHGERAPDAAQLPGQRKLAGELLALERLRRELAARGEDAERDGQVEARRVLRQLRRREVDRHAARRKLEAGMVERRPDAIAR